MSVSYHKVRGLPFYSLNEFTQLQPLSRGSSVIYLYQHHQSQEVFVVKEVPYRDELVRVYETLAKLSGLDGVVRMRGLCKMVIKYERLPQKRRHEISEQSFGVEASDHDHDHDSQRKQARGASDSRSQEKVKQEEWLLLFLERCEENILEQIKIRKRERRPFKCE